MSRKIIFLFAVIIITVSNVYAEVPTQSRVLFHGTRQISENWGMAGWSIFPNIVQDTKNLIVTGPRYSYNNGWVEMLAGKIITADGNSTLYNIRTFSKHLPVHIWGEIEYFPKDKTMYWFLQTDLPINIAGKFIGKIGLETENVHQPDQKSNLGVGPHIIVPVAKNMTIIFAHQWRYQEENLYRFYTIIDF